MTRRKRLEFTTLTKLQATLRYTRCPGLFEINLTCGRPLSDGVEHDHIKRCEVEPDNSPANCRPLCPTCHAIKTAMDQKAAKKGRHIRRETKKSQQPKAKFRSGGPVPGSKASNWKHRMDGTWVRR